MLGLFINVLFILGSIENSISPETTIEENDSQIMTSVQEKMIQSCAQVSQNVSEDFMQGQLSQESCAFQTNTEELVVEQGDHLEKGALDKFEGELKVAEENKLIDLENLPYNGIVQKIKFLERETSEDTREPNQKKEVALSNLPLVCPHPLNIEKAAQVCGPEGDAEHLDLFWSPLLSSICTNDLPDLEDAESTVVFPTEQSSKQKIFMYPENEEAY